MKRCALLILILTFLPPPAVGQRAGVYSVQDSSTPDFEFARAAVERGEILPLAVALKQLQETHPGQVTEIEMDQEDGLLIYEVELITTDGRLIEVEMDARTGTIIKLEESDDEEDDD
ncbi:peptidase (plasmid) [Paracoccus kondratievae]|uniref:PepSY domain-containing protein n=1 Tax=Paracoccus kondratievae TaxID=135740 RepID=A0AAD3RU20_9RHOB|nr:MULTISPECIES: PepSY domain-containing protein [Paracoccus]QFQ89569.1 peptidase [Paracoccus kondratievae]GLK64412.1 hypothetical protein GCM10017635_18830 [Paracoccus kondratievae]SMG41534.1 Peptidase propeptide and YPEB domain-containing protein [Paracoccus sp. J56]